MSAQAAPARALRPVVTGLALVATGAAHAHQAMDGELPATGLQGLWSGLAHPVVEADHLLFLLGAAMLVAAARVPIGAARLLLMLFALAGVGGTLVHGQGVALPAAELGVTVSLLVVAFGLLRARLGAGAAVPLTLAAGLLHGYAYGESIVGAESAALWAYLLGLVLVQGTLLVLVHGAWPALAARGLAWSMALSRMLALLLGMAAAWALMHA